MNDGSWIPKIVLYLFYLIAFVFVAWHIVGFTAREHAIHVAEQHACADHGGMMVGSGSEALCGDATTFRVHADGSLTQVQ